MRLLTIAFSLGLPCLFAICQPVIAAEPDPKTLEIGATAPDFQLPGVDGRQHLLKDFADAKVLAVIFTCNHCPTAQTYESRIMQLDADYKGQGVAVVAISPNDNQALRLDELAFTDLGDSFEEMKIRAKERGFKFPYLYDGERQNAARAYGAMATPHVFIFDGERKLRYVGRIDNADANSGDTTAISHDARNALDALLAGKPVPVEKTRTFGCSTKWSEKRADAEASIKKWNQEPVTLEPLDAEGLTKLARNDSDKLLLINVWATWCGPCIAELPELVTTNRMYRPRKFEMVTINFDEPEKKADALKVLQDNHVAATNYISTVADRDQFADLLDKEWAGPLPYTLLIAPGAKVIYRKSGPVDAIELRRAIVEHLGRDYAPPYKN